MTFPLSLAAVLLLLLLLAPAVEGAQALQATASAVRLSASASAAHKASLRRSYRTRSRALRGTLAQDPAEEVVEWHDSGLALKSLLSQDALRSLTSQITGEVYGKQLHEFCASASGTGGYSTRYIGSVGNLNAAAYLKGQLEELGLKVWTQDLEHTADMMPYVTPEMKRQNVLGMLKGSGDLQKEVMVIGAHFDSVNWQAKDHGEVDAPGVDDNGSGVAAVLLVAKALAKHQPRRSIIFAFFNGEEEGLIGSKAFAKMAISPSWRGEYGDVKGAIILDEVAYPGRGGQQSSTDGAIFETVEAVPGAASLVDTMANLKLMNTDGDGITGFMENKHGFGSDHMSFLDLKIPAVLLIERDDMWHADTWGHSSNDTFDHVEHAYGASMTRLALRTIATISSPIDSQPARLAAVTATASSPTASQPALLAAATVTASSPTASQAASWSASLAAATATASSPTASQPALLAAATATVT